MYNGIGLLTPRGSGTSGHVQTNKFNVRQGPSHRAIESTSTAKPAQERKPNEDILEHHKKREIEAKLYELAETLRDEGYGEDEIEKEVASLREQMMGSNQPADTKQKLTDESHEMWARKQEELSNMKRALGLGDVKEGEAFDRELQEKKRLQRIADREAREKERAREDKARAKQRDREAREDRKHSSRAADHSEKEHKRQKRHADEYASHRQHSNGHDEALHSDRKRRSDSEHRSSSSKHRKRDS